MGFYSCVMKDQWGESRLFVRLTYLKRKNYVLGTFIYQHLESRQSLTLSTLICCLFQKICDFVFFLTYLDIWTFQKQNNNNNKKQLKNVKCFVQCNTKCYFW